MCYNLLISPNIKGKKMCLFCKIVNKEIPSNIILEDDNFIAFHDINPKAPLHILAIPKLHMDSFTDVRCEMMSNMTSFIKKIAEEVKIEEIGYRFITNTGDYGGQEVKHLHFHVLGGAKLKW